MRRAFVIVALLSACGDPNRPSRAPLAMTIPSVAPVQAAPAAPVETEAAAESSLQLVFAGTRLCVRSEGRVHCQPTSGSLVTPLVQDQLRVEGVDDAVDLAGSDQIMCAVTRRGTVTCAGSNTWGELGARSDEGHRETFGEVVGVTHARRVSVGSDHVCALLDDKSVTCWGRNDFGQTGSDTIYRPEARQLVKASVVPNVKAESVVATSESTCARTPEREVVCWGLLQDPKTGYSRATRPTRVPELDDVSALYAHGIGYCALRRGKILCWGHARGLVAGVDRSDHGVVTVREIKDAQQLAISDRHACALHADGRVSCFGYPSSTALGRSMSPEPQVQYVATGPGLVEGLPRARFVAAGGSQSCALTSDDASRADVYCWGRWYTDAGAHDEPKPIVVPLR